MLASRIHKAISVLFKTSKNSQIAKLFNQTGMIYQQQRKSFSYRINYNASTKKPLPIQSKRANNLKDNKTQVVKYQTAFLMIKKRVYELIPQSEKQQFIQELLLEVNKLFKLISTNSKIKSGAIQYTHLLQIARKQSKNKISPLLFQVMKHYCYFLRLRSQNQKSVLISAQMSAYLKKANTQKILQLTKQNAKILYVLGVQYFQLRKIQQSKKAFQEQIKICQGAFDQNCKEIIQPKDNLAIIEFWKGNFDISMKIFQKNAQISKRIMKQQYTLKQKIYAKHYVFLQAIYDWKLQSSLNQQQKNLLKQKLIQTKNGLQMIRKANPLKHYGQAIYMQTASLSFLHNNLPQLALKYIQKSLSFTKLDLQIQKNNKNLTEKKKNQYFFYNMIARNNKIMADCYAKLDNLPKAIKNYQQSLNSYAKLFNSNLAEQLLDLNHIRTFFQTAKSLSTSIEQQMKDNNLQQSTKKDNKIYQLCIKYLQIPLNLWAKISEHFWSLPQSQCFIPSQLNCLIGIVYLKQQKYVQSLNHLSFGINQVYQNKDLLDKKLKETFGDITKKINLQLARAPKLQTNQKQIDQITKLYKKLRKIV